MRHTIDLVGERGKYPAESMGQLVDSRLSDLGKRTRTDIWVKPFQIERHGATFGLVPRHVEGSGWVVEFMPGNTLQFFPPWETGEYDT